MNDLYDRLTVEILTRSVQTNSNCIDVGCHKGDILTSILTAAPTGEHYAFEPIPALCQDLKSRFPTVNVYNVALSDQSGMSSFQHVISNPSYSGLLRRRFDRPNEVVEKIEVKCERLDDIIPHELKIDFIKIDVEGAELQVLRGAQRTIESHRPVIVFEHGLGGSDFYGTTPELVHDFLSEGCGLRVSLLQTWVAFGRPLDRPEFIDQFLTGKNYYFVAHRAN